MTEFDRRSVLAAAGVGLSTGALQGAVAGRRLAAPPEVVWTATAESTPGTWWPLDDVGILVERPEAYRYDGDGHAVSLLDVETGRRLDRFETPGYVWRAAPRTAERDVLVYARPSQDLDDGTTGSLLRVDLAERTMTEVATYDGHPLPTGVPGVFAVDRGDRADVRRVDPVDGHTIWERAFDHSLLYPGTADGLLFTANSRARADNAVVALNLDDGSTRARTAVEGVPTYGTLTRGGSAALATRASEHADRGRVHVFDATTGDRRWSKRVEASRDARIVPVLGAEYAGYRAGSSDPEATDVGLFDAETGDPWFETTVEGASPWDVRFDDSAWYVWHGGELRARDVDDGSELWTVTLSAAEFPRVLDESALLGDGSTVRSVALPEGDVRWERTFDGEVTLRGRDRFADGTERLYVSVDGTLYALEGPDVTAWTPTPTATPSPTQTASPSSTPAATPSPTPTERSTPTPGPVTETDGTTGESSSGPDTASGPTDATGGLSTWLTLVALAIAALLARVRDEA